MKRRLLTGMLVLATCVVGAFGFASCGGDDSSSTSVESSVSAEQSVESADSSVNSATASTSVESSADSSIEESSTESSVESSSIEESSSAMESDSSIESSSTEDSSSEDSSSTEQQSTEGIIYTLSDDGTYYIVTDYKGTATDVVIAGTYKNLPVTMIGEDAFYECSSLTSVVIPDGVTTIGDNAFEDCTSLTSIEIPDGVTTIGGSAFRFCDSLTSVVIGDSVTTIGSHAFYYCDSLTSVVIGGSVTTIGEDAFSSCYSLTSVYITDIAAWCNISFGDLDANPLHYAHNLYVNNELATELVIPDSVTTIGNYAFYECDSLTRVVIPDSVTKIGDNAFEDCTSLTSIEIPDGVTTIGDNAFHNCYNLTSATLPAFAISYISKTNLQTVVITSGDTISNFSHCTKLTSVVIPDSVTSIGSYTFFDCTSLTSVVIPDSVKTIGDYAFFSCGSLTSVTLPQSVTSIGERGFDSCVGLMSINIPDGVTSIGNYAFFYCYGLTIYCEVLNQPSEWDDEWNTSNCPIVWDCNNNDVANDGYIYTVAGGARYRIKDDVAMVATQPINITSINILQTIVYKDMEYSVTAIESYAFSEYLTSVVIGDSITTIPAEAFIRCIRLTSITVAEGNEIYKSIDDNLYSKDGKILISYAKGKTEAEFVIPDGVTTIGEFAFENCDNLTSIVIPNSVTLIGEHAFFNCYSLTRVVFPDSVTSIGRYAFGNCYSLKSIVVPDSVTYIASEAFRNCNGLTIVVIGNGVETIDSWAFKDCTSLTSVYYKGTVEEWKDIEISIYNNTDLTSATRYYYVENEADVPTDGGNYWHYDENGNIVVW